MSEPLTLATFEPHVGTDFLIDVGLDEAIVFNLFQATALTTHDYPGKQREPFQMRFKCDCTKAGVTLPQGNYLVSNTALGEMELFVVPIGEEGGETLYQAVFT